MNKGIRKKTLAMSNTFLNGIETSIIKSDVVIYALVLLGIILYLIT